MLGNDFLNASKFMDIRDHQTNQKNEANAKKNVNA